MIAHNVRVRRPRGRRRACAVFYLTALLLALTACGNGNNEGGAQRPPAANPPASPAPNPPASLGSGALGGPRVSEASSWTPQKAADHILNYGLSYDSGVEHNPRYVRCEATDATDIFDCYVDVEGVAPYWIRLTAIDDASARFEFRYYD